MDAQQTKIYTAIIIAGLIIGVILLYFIFTLIRQQRRNSQLFREKIKAEINTLEKERSRVAADLHDELGPLLFSVKFKLSNLETSNEDSESVEQASAYIDDIIQRLREISNDLMPSTLLRKGLVYALEEYINSLSGKVPLQINLTHANIPELDKDKSVNLYRLLMEIIHNTLKHSKANQLNISINYNDDILSIDSTDNGIGFEYDPMNQKFAGLGLRSMLNRVEILDGEMFIESALLKGTTFTIKIPFTKQMK